MTSAMSPSAGISRIHWKPRRCSRSWEQNMWSSRAGAGCGRTKFLLRNGADAVAYPEKQLAKWAAIRYTSNHIFSYIELDGDPTQNLEAFEAVVRAMKEAASATVRSTTRSTAIRSAAIPALLAKYVRAAAAERAKAFRCPSCRSWDYIKITTAPRSAITRPCRRSRPSAEYIENRQKVTGKGEFYHGN